ncbi:TonB-dependent receptor [Sphingomonas leidyi]|uniref:TonB-dependent receptor n=1 Tax=Sphingomonas leidyi TaxID=68569 RepID=UPI0014240532|nr:TonB-dependent receptor [Sphingomonas leidyi]
MGIAAVRCANGFCNVRWSRRSIASVLLTLNLAPAPADGRIAAGEAATRRASDQAQRNAQDREPGQDDIVVTAPRRGDAQVAAETEFSEDQIASQGLDSIDDLLLHLRPFLGPDGEEPVLLINGRPAGFDRSILGYPPEALTRLAILKPEAAARYGAAPGRRVVNLVLKQHFASLDLDASTSAPLRGGQMSNGLIAARTIVHGDARWNIRANIGRDSGMRKNARSIPRDAGVYDRSGVISAPDGGEIDPALSAAAGSTITTAALPGLAPTMPPALADLVATAGQGDPFDPNAYISLQPARKSVSLTIGMARPVGPFGLSLSLTANSLGSEALRGVPMASVVLPAGNPWSPFSRAILLTRPLDGISALRANNLAQSLGGSLMLNGSVAGWQANLGINYRISRNDNLLETGIDTRSVQRLLDIGDPAFNPYARWPRHLLLGTRTRTASDDWSVRIDLQKGVVQLPAGPLTISLSGNASRTATHMRQHDTMGNAISTNDRSRDQANVQAGLAVPIARRGNGPPSPIGDLSVDLTAGWQSMSESKPQWRLSSGVTWSPISAVQFRAMLDDQQASPSMAELDGPIITTVMRMVDYAKQVVAEPIVITGGNPALKGGSRREMRVSAMVRPLKSGMLTFNVGYRQTVSKNMPSPLPELTPAIEAAFKDRIARDADGNLVSIDARSINIAKDRIADLSGGLALRFAGGNATTIPGARADPVQYTLALNETYHLKSDMLVKAGLPVIDRLRGGSGLSRHTVSLQFDVGTRGLGASLGASWNSAARIVSPGSNPDQAFRVTPPLTIGLSTFLNPDNIFRGWRDNPLTKGWKISATVQNLLNRYRRVALVNGQIPTGYTHDEIDPLGRTIRLQIRKRF